MYKLVIADDESVIRKGLAELVDWNKLGFELAGCFSDGSEVIEYLEENKVDVIFTDIKMGNVSGIDLAKYVFENHRPIKVVILSGYKEFELAKKAIDYGVESYLLKPTRFNEVVSLFEGIKKKLDLESDKRVEEQNYKELVPLLQEQLVADLLIGNFKEGNSLEKYLGVLNLKIDLRQRLCHILTLKVKNYDSYLSEKWQYGKEAFKNVICNFLRSDNSGINLFYTFHSNDNLDILAIPTEKVDEHAFKDTLNTWADDVRKKILDELKLEIEIDFKECYDNIYEMAISGQTRVKSELLDSAKGENVVDSKHIEEMYKHILSKVASGDFNEAHNLVNLFFNEVIHLQTNKVLEIYMNFIEFMKEQIKQMGLKLSAFERKFCDSAELAQRDNLYIKNIALEAIDYISNQLTAKNVSPTQMLVTKTKQYIQENYMKDISLEEVANKVFLNPAYLSRIFKQQEGETFTDYLTKVRIKKAEELLMQRRFRLNDISLMTGFKNSRYFCKVFKLQTGYSPKEYSYKCLFTDGGNDDE